MPIQMQADQILDALERTGHINHSVHEAELLNLADRMAIDLCEGLPDYVLITPARNEFGMVCVPFSGPDDSNFPLPLPEILGGYDDEGW